MFRTTLCYIEQNDAYLMLLRNKKKKDINEGKWIGVGGKLEAGESPEACMLREVYEETGLTVTKFSFRGLIHFLPDGAEDEEMYLYTVSEFSGELTEDCNEGTLRWIPKDEILGLHLWEGDPYFLKKLLRNDPPFHMALVYDVQNRLTQVREYPDTPAPEKSGYLICPHGFSTRMGGKSQGIYTSLNLGMNRGDAQTDVTENWRIFMDACGIEHDLPFVCGEQVHGANVVIATSADARPAYGAGHMHKADGYVTAEANLPLAIFTADCVPVLLQDAKAHVIGAVHCGWRSTVADIEKSAIDAFVSLGSNVGDIHIAIGPSIDQCCFEVGEEVVLACEQLLYPTCERTDRTDADAPSCDPINALSSSPADALSGSPADTLSDHTASAPSDIRIHPLHIAPYVTPSSLHEDKYMLHLRGIVAERFMQLGVKKEHIELVGTCTMCHPEKYYSHRYTGGLRGSNASVICQ